jgi:hypothetical protein
MSLEILGADLRWPDYQRLLGGIAMADQQPNDELIANPEFQDREASFVKLDPNGRRLIICSDERALTKASMALLTEQYDADPINGYNRDFGGLTGQAHDAAVVMATSQPEALEPYRNDLVELIMDTKRLFAFAEPNGGVFIPIDHSAAHNEGEDAHLAIQAEAGLGCAFDALFGGTQQIEATNTEVQDKAREEYLTTVDSDATSFDKIVAGAKQAFEVLSNNDASFGLTRKALDKTADHDDKGRIIAAILEGNHVDVKDVVDIANYVPNSASLPHVALKNNAPAFVTDMTDTTLALVRAFHAQGIELDPKYVFAAKILKRAAVRFALAGNKARTMATTTRGDAKEALAYINEQLAA